MAAPDNDSRIVLQAHKLRSDLAAGALVHGGASQRGRKVGVQILIISLLIAAVIIVGIVVTGYVIDLIAARRR